MTKVKRVRVKRRRYDFLNDKPSDVFSYYLRTLERCGANAHDVGHIALQTIRHLQGNRAQRSFTVRQQVLENRWYESVAKGKPDYSVYKGEYYLGELWACWSVYSRKYLRALAKPDPVCGMPPRDHFGTVRSVLDLGCGVGLTTAALKQLFPRASVVGTNLPGTLQTEIATRIANDYGAAVQGEPRKADVVFASEYFEHFPRPIHHLRDVLAVAKPRVLIVANTFGARSIGHFLQYDQGDGFLVDGRATSRAFSSELRDAGFERVQTRFWNNRPAYWRR